MSINLHKIIPIENQDLKLALKLSTPSKTKVSISTPQISFPNTLLKLSYKSSALKLQSKYKDFDSNLSFSLQTGPIIKFKLSKQIDSFLLRSSSKFCLLSQSLQSWRLMLCHHGHYFNTLFSHHASSKMPSGSFNSHQASETSLFLSKSYKNLSLSLHLPDLPLSSFTIAGAYSPDTESELRLLYSPALGLCPSISTYLSPNLQVQVSFCPAVRFSFVWFAFWV